MCLKSLHTCLIAWHDKCVIVCPSSLWPLVLTVRVNGILVFVSRSSFQNFESCWWIWDYSVELEKHANERLIVTSVKNQATPWPRALNSQLDLSTHDSSDSIDSSSQFHKDLSSIGPLGLNPYSIVRPRKHSEQLPSNWTKISRFI